MINWDRYIAEARDMGILQENTEEIAAQGRGGDDNIMHVSDDELAVMDQISMQAGQGPLPTNPVTGKKEAFSFLLPLLMAGGGAALGALTSKDAGVGAVGGGILGLLGGLIPGMSGMAGSTSTAATATEALSPALAAGPIEAAPLAAAPVESLASAGLGLPEVAMSPGSSVLQAGERAAQANMGGMGGTFNREAWANAPDLVGIQPPQPSLDTLNPVATSRATIPTDPRLASIPSIEKSSLAKLGDSMSIGGAKEDFGTLMDIIKRNKGTSLFTGMMGRQLMNKALYRS